MEPFGGDYKTQIKSDWRVTIRRYFWQLTGGFIRDIYEQKSASENKFTKIRVEKYVTVSDPINTEGFRIRIPIFLKLSC